MDINSVNSSSFASLRRIEEELFGNEQFPSAHPKAMPARMAAQSPRRKTDPVHIDDTWRMSREILEAKREIAALQSENDTLRQIITEQNVMSTSSVSALRELRQDYDQIKKETHHRELRLESQAAEIAQLKAEVETERAHCLELSEKAGRLAGQAEILGELASAGQKAVSEPQEKPETATAPIQPQDPLSAMRKNLAPFVRGQYP